MQTLLAQEPTDSPLFIALVQADSLVFERGFNHCDLEVLETVIHPDFEFFHDQNGRQDREGFFAAFRESICANADVKPIRKLVEGSLSVYPLSNNGVLYGAIQMGDHDFYLAEPEEELRLTAHGRFIHTWLLVEGKWKLARVLSYDHRQP